MRYKVLNAPVIPILPINVKAVAAASIPVCPSEHGHEHTVYTYNKTQTTSTDISMSFLQSKTTPRLFHGDTIYLAIRF